MFTCQYIYVKTHTNICKHKHISNRHMWHIFICMFTLSVIFVPHFPTGKCKYDESHILLIGTITTSFYHIAGQEKDALSASSITAQKQDIYISIHGKNTTLPRKGCRVHNCSTAMWHCHYWSRCHLQTHKRNKNYFVAKFGEDFREDPLCQTTPLSLNSHRPVNTTLTMCCKVFQLISTHIDGIEDLHLLDVVSSNQKPRRDSKSRSKMVVHISNTSHAGSSLRFEDLYHIL